MSKVIRIEDEIFGRLQNHAEPFVDTPSSVIEKLLNYYESSLSKPETTHAHASQGRRESPMRNIFLAPASDENLRKTIRGSVSLTSITHLLSKEERQVLQSSVKNVEALNCWAMTEGSRSKFNEMTHGDLVLFTAKDSGKFQYTGEVVAKIDSEKLGGFLWDFVPTKPWKLVYFLGNIQAVNIDKTRLVTALGYSKSYVVPGITKVNPIARDTILAQHGTIESFIASIDDLK
ncbi:hypothetical protein F6V25_07640 [Oryzomonas japonica]|uniref:Uncharacterized protein n=1 Tax=Oryzomonas japonica TaxID=2603858 RepID=A0A7J4ZRL4_9BACT|nr:hypothetical protein [Oryzomonas japonica]KAB0665587.1 hypothetical protein F6V25_07640 [Oryzomonas japonica]